MALPPSAGAIQETARLVLLPVTAATVGAAGATGAVAVVPVVPDPEPDQAESPSALVARTWTW